MNKYSIIKDIVFTNISYIDMKKLNGFKFKPSNKVCYDGITVNKMTVVNSIFVEKILKRKIKKRLEVYLRFIISLVENNEETDPTDLRSALNDLSKYKDIIRYKYQMYLDQKYTMLLLKKIELLEKELKEKIYKSNNFEQEHRRSR